MKNKNYLLFNPSMIIIVVLLIILIPVFIWSKSAYLEQVTHAKGSVIASAKTQSIQTAIDGVIDNILVKEGAHVKQGEKLIILDKTQIEASYEAIFAKVAALSATLSRLKSEVYGIPLTFSKDVEKYPEFENMQRSLFDRRQLSLSDELKIYYESLDLLTNELKIYEILLKHGDIGQIEINKLKQQIIDIKGKITNRKNKYFQDSQTELNKVEEELSTRLQELEEKKVNLEHTTIVASKDSIVKNILITTQGAKVRAGEIILELVPTNDKLIVEAKIDPKNFSFIKVGQKVAVKLDAYDYSIYGIFNGKVSYISPDALEDKTNRDTEYYFRVLIELNNEELISKNGKIIKINPGMSCDVDIITGKRTVFDYIVKPITKTLSESFKER